MTGDPALPPAAIRRITTAVIARELRRLRDEDIGQSKAAETVGHETTDPLALDSLETMGVATALGAVFQQDDLSFAPDTPATSADWAARIATRPIERLTVYTSGATGRPQPHAHTIADLLAEAHELARQFARTRRVVALVPADHLYGLIWTALLPAILDVPVIAGTVLTLPAPAAGDLIVGVPEHWAALARLGKPWPADVTGISSGGALPAALGEDLIAAGLTRLVDVYGSSETGAIGLREVPAIGYTLLSRWQLTSAADTATLVDREGQPVSLPDDIRPIDERRIELLGRRDHAVQVGGINVYPDRIAAVLGECAGVASAVVRLGDHGRLKAFIVPAGEPDEAALEQQLRQFVAARLAPVERPTSFRFGAELPRNPMGKPADWR
ncbi:AMP-binding protein [Salinisphaera hydrothermalis]|uniref:AMP-binding protein n=1 Tax=Salinisphaera hydrothermalis TaxID=563188 RepID=UPI003341BB97